LGLVLALDSVSLRLSPGGASSRPDCDPLPYLPRNGIRPWRIDSVHPLDARQLLGEQRARMIITGVSIILTNQWTASEIYPTHCSNLVLQPSQRQVDLLDQFGSL
jgi:hypothetical protein